jgi:hypothetical protein
MRLCPGQNRLFAVPREPVGRVSPGRHALLKLMPLYATRFGSMIGSCGCPPWNRPTSESIETSSCSPSPAAQRTATEPASALSARCGHARSLASRCRRLRSASFHPGPGEAGTRGTTRRTRRRAGAWRRSGAESSSFGATRASRTGRNVYGELGIMFFTRVTLSTRSSRG